MKISDTSYIKYFTSSIDLHAHPMKSSKPKMKICYYTALEYFVRQCQNDCDYIRTRLSQYQYMLAGDRKILVQSEKKKEAAIKTIVNNSTNKKKKVYRYWLLCDVALILVDEGLIKKAHELFKRYLKKKQGLDLDKFYAALWSDDKALPSMSSAGELLNQVRTIQRFNSQAEKRFIVTANMSAGKSTLINALIGKPIAKTSLEACTANLCYFYSKPLEDNCVHLITSRLNLNATDDDLENIDKKSPYSVASYFRSSVDYQSRICVIDTPGVNSAINPDHGKLTRRAILEESYDKLIYVLNANMLGTDDEIRHLKYVYENVPSEKIIFVLNKLDTFKSEKDSISESIDGVKDDLEKIGYKDCAVYPLSAYFALLMKMKKNSEIMTKKEERILHRMIEDFDDAEYNFSLYHSNIDIMDSINDESMLIMKKSGMYNLEKILSDRRIEQ